MTFSRFNVLRFATFLNALSLNSSGRTFAHWAVATCGIYELGGILFVMGSVCFMPNQGCKEGMEILGAWCFIVGAACYMLGDFIELMMLGWNAEWNLASLIMSQMFWEASWCCFQIQEDVRSHLFATEARRSCTPNRECHALLFVSAPARKRCQTAVIVFAMVTVPFTF